MPGPIEPATYRGLPSAASNSSHTRLAIAAACTLISCAFSGIEYSARTVENAPNVAVSTASTPASRNALCMLSITSGRVSTSISLQPSREPPPKSSGPRSRPCTKVPTAPSKTTTRSLMASV